MMHNIWPQLNTYISHMIREKNTSDKACVKLLYSQYFHAKSISQPSTGKGIKQINFVSKQRVQWKTVLVGKL